MRFSNSKSFFILLGLTAGLVAQEADSVGAALQDSVDVELSQPFGSIPDTLPAEVEALPDSIEVQPPMPFESFPDTSQAEDAVLPDTVEVQIPLLSEPASDTSPVEITFTPLHKTVGVPLDTVLTITFSKPVRNIDDTPVTYDQISEFISLKSINKKGPDVPFTTDINEEKTVVTIDPESELDDDQRFFLSLSYGLEDEFNNVVRPANIRFNTKMKVALLEFELKGLSSIENRSLLTYMRTELNATGIAVCLEKEEVDDILRNNRIDPSGCKADDCAAEIGTALGVSYMVLTDIAKLEKNEDYVTAAVVLQGDISLRLLNVKREKLKRKVHREFSGGLNRLGRIVRRMVWDLVEVKPTEGRFGVDVEKVTLLDRMKIEVTEFLNSPREWIFTHPQFAIGVASVALLSAGISMVAASQADPVIGGPPEYPEVP